MRSEAGAAAFTAATGAPALVLDLNDVAAMPGIVAQAEALAGPIDILINNAGFGHEGSLEESPLDALRRQLDVNVVGPVALMQAVLHGMRARQRGHIVNITSMAGSTGLTGVSFYCGAKFALEGISEALGKEVRRSASWSPPSRRASSAPTGPAARWSARRARSPITTRSWTRSAPSAWPEAASSRATQTRRRRC
ncbi:SDR family NAD(P)-dependent oxidoreductase [Sphingobium scionense]